MTTSSRSVEYHIQGRAVIGVNAHSIKGPHACLDTRREPLLQTTDNTLFVLFLQLLLIGDSGVGKSCLLLRFAVGNSQLAEGNVSDIGW